MKQYNIKPIRIRFISGGVECASLTQLRFNFVPKDVKKSFLQFIKWLNQNKEEEIINELNAYKEELREDSVDSLFCLYSIIYKEFCLENNIGDLYDLFLKWHHNDRDKDFYVSLRDEIRSRDWGELFFLGVAQKYLESKTDSVESSSSLFELYKEILWDYFEKNEISNLTDLYIYLASKSVYRESFFSLDTTIKKQNWQINYYLQLIPNLFVPCQNDKGKLSSMIPALSMQANSIMSVIIANSKTAVESLMRTEGYTLLPLENISQSFATEEETFSFYEFFLGDFLLTNKYKKLSDICLFFLENYEQNENFILLQDIIRKSEWKFDFVKVCFPKIFEKLHHGIKLNPNKQTFLSNANAGQIFEIYKLFLGDYFQKLHINNLGELYLFWDSNSETKNAELFNDLHKEIVKAPWCSQFLNNLAETLFVNFRRNHIIEPSSSTFNSIDEELLYKDFFCVYFDYYTRSRYINNITDILIRWTKDSAMCGKECHVLLMNVMKNNLWGILHFLEIYKTDRHIFSYEEWKDLLGDLAQSECVKTPCLFEIGRIYVNDFSMYEEGCKLIHREIEFNNTDAISFYNKCVRKESSITNDFKESYIHSDKIEWDSHPNGDENFIINEELLSSARTLRDQWILMIQWLIHKIMHEKDFGLIFDFVAFIRELPKPLPYSYALESSPKKFLHAFQNDSRDKVSSDRMNEVKLYVGDSFLEFRFVFGLICRNHSNYEKEGNAILESIRDKYIPAKYLLNGDMKNPVLDKIKFRESVRANINKALKEYCQIMVYFAN